MYDHLVLKPFPRGYTFWFSHVEKRVDEPVVESHPRPKVMDARSCGNNPIQYMVHDAFGYHPNDETMDEVVGGIVLTRTCNVWFELSHFFTASSQYLLVYPSFKGKWKAWVNQSQPTGEELTVFLAPRLLFRP
ncbi:cysteine-rich receptor-like protein kinase 15 [Senna tora]|uniref:Cysteine-rich receptor-like protein kinase 15 n=1 Tax=Senna tora TaxID=362788 RepID=A0A834XEK4_9FABA|nr:cysteine-rich receptor-like protein kinase 15 [Senna tora]